MIVQRSTTLVAACILACCLRLAAAQSNEETSTIRQEPGRRLPAEVLAERPVAELHVRLVPPPGRSVDGVEVCVVRKENRASTWEDRSGAEFDIPLGRGFQAGEIYLIVHATGFATARSELFTMQRQVGPLVVELKAEQPVSVRGRVVDCDGRPVSQARVRVARRIFEPKEEFPWGLEGTTDADGRYELEQARAGDEIRVKVDKPSFRSSQSDWVNLDDGRERLIPDVRLCPVDEIGQYAVMLRAESVGRGSAREFPAIAFAAVPNGTLLVSASSGALPFLSGDVSFPVGSIRLIGTGAAPSSASSSKRIQPRESDRQADAGAEVTLIHYDQARGVSLFAVGKQLPVLPAALISDEPLAVGDSLTELQLTNSAESTTYKVVSVDNTLTFNSYFGRIDVAHVARIDGRLREAPGSLLLKDGRLAGVFVGNQTGPNDFWPAILPVDRVRLAFSWLSRDVRSRTAGRGHQVP